MASFPSELPRIFAPPHRGVPEPRYQRIGREFPDPRRSAHAGWRWRRVRCGAAEAAVRFADLGKFAAGGHAHNGLIRPGWGFCGRGGFAEANPTANSAEERSGLFRLRLSACVGFEFDTRAMCLQNPGPVVEKPRGVPAGAGLCGLSKRRIMSSKSCIRRIIVTNRIGKCLLSCPTTRMKARVRVTRKRLSRRILTKRTDSDLCTSGTDGAPCGRGERLQSSPPPKSCGRKRAFPKRARKVQKSCQCEPPSHTEASIFDERDRNFERYFSALGLRDGGPPVRPASPTAKIDTNSK